MEGQVLLYGADPKDYSLAKLSGIVGTLLQDPEKQILGAHVKSEVSFGPENLGLPASEVWERVDEALNRLDIMYLRDRETFSISGGEKQKAALAGLLAMRPSILLLDEPLASLDPASAREALAVFRHLADEGSTILLVEHRVEDALNARPDRILYLKEGEVRYLGRPDNLAEVVDWHEVKLPAQQVMQRVRATGTPTPPPAPADRKLRTWYASPLIVFDNVSFAYGDGPEILKNVSLEIRTGETVAILGPNAAGKSTLIKHAIGLLKPRKGRVLVDGKDTRELSVAQIARTLGYAFQSPTHMLFAPTVKEELAFGPQNLGYKPEEIDKSITASLDALNLAGLESYPPLSLSFGQQKRVTIACVATMRSKILALDEPTAGQDYGNYMSFMDSILGADNTADGNKSPLSNFDAMLFITHDLDLAVTYATRAILVSNGAIAGDGQPETVLKDYDLLKRCRVVPTSLLDENLRLLPKTHKFQRAEVLAGVK
ncbi:MAG: ABC transporter ATP-binding protein [Chloroflexi bacterium]|nr:ABC transporter ATP-binding protein [Chloroflexota bacterium]